MSTGTVSAGSVKRSPRAASRRFGGVDWWIWAPLALGVAYLIAVLTQFTGMVAAAYLNGDAASAPVIGELFGGSPAHREVVLGKMAWFSTLLFELGTRWLPAHRQIWEATPYIVALLSVGLLAWGAWQIAGRWAATIAGVIALCASPATLSWLLSFNDHSPDWLCNALLAAFLVLLGRRKTGVWPLIAVAAAVGVIVGVNLASDPLVAIGGVAPFVLAVVVTWGRPSAQRRGRAFSLAGGSLVAMVAVDELTRLFMHHENVVASAAQNNNALASMEQIPNNFRFWWQSIAVLGDGNFFGQTAGFTSVLEVICALLAVAAVVVVAPRVAWHEVTDAFKRSTHGALDEYTSSVQGEYGSVGTGAPSWSRSDSGQIGDEGRLAWCVFWGSSLVFLSVAFLVSSVPAEIYDDRYLVGLVYAVAALLPLGAARSAARKAVIVLGTCVFAFTGIVGVVEGHASENPAHWPEGYLDGRIVAIARREHLKIGYAGYWDAAAITWGTHMAVNVFPIQPCSSSKLYCPFYEHYISSWYTPRPDTRSFLISDPIVALYTSYIPQLGKPSAVYSIGQLTMYVFPYDIASRMER